MKPDIRVAYTNDKGWFMWSIYFNGFKMATSLDDKLTLKSCKKDFRAFLQALGAKTKVREYT